MAKFAIDSIQIPKFGFQVIRNEVGSRTAICQQHIFSTVDCVSAALIKRNEMIRQQELLY